MSSRRTLVVIAAVVIGAIASFALFQYTASVKDEAYGNARRVEVLVVTKDIPKGMLGADVIRDGYVGTVLIPQEIRPATALVSTAGLESLVARSDLAANQVVVDQMFVTPEQAYASSSERIEEGMVAITMSVDQVHGVAGLVVPGDRVDMIIGDPAGTAAPGVEGEDGQRRPRTWSARRRRCSSRTSGSSPSARSSPPTWARRPPTRKWRPRPPRPPAT